jgi:hypothetical protein
MVVLHRAVTITPTVVGMHRRTEVDLVRSARSCQLDCGVRCGRCDLVSAWITVISWISVVECDLLFLVTVRIDFAVAL